MRAGSFSTRTRKASWLIASVGIALAACHHEAKVGSDAAPPPDFEAKLRADSPRAKDELWQAALAGEVRDVARLADREGAVGLLEGLEEGGPVALAALTALPYADDAELSLRRLGEIAIALDADKARPVLDAVLGISSRRRRQTEPLDPGGARSCAEALLDIARRKDLAVRARARAISALRLLADRGAVDARAIPVDLDAK
jgi:hypothetical protein